MQPNNQASSAASDRNILISDITTNNVATTKHGFFPKLDNTATHFIDMTGSQRALAASDLPNGVCVQMVSTNFSAVATGATAIPNDDSIPQSGEGVEFMTQAITPKSATNTLVIQCTAMIACAGLKLMAGALFQDAAVNAIAGEQVTSFAAGAPLTLSLDHTMTSGTTSSTTFRFRAGCEDTTTLTFNGIAGARKLGAITKSNVTIWEYKS